jgi:hypothetical protein
MSAKRRVVASLILCAGMAAALLLPARFLSAQNKAQLARQGDREEPSISFKSRHHRQCPLLVERVHAGTTLSTLAVKREDFIRVSLGPAFSP